MSLCVTHVCTHVHAHTMRASLCPKELAGSVPKAERWEGRPRRPRRSALEPGTEPKRPAQPACVTSALHMTRVSDRTPGLSDSLGREGVAPGKRQAMAELACARSRRGGSTQRPESQRSVTRQHHMAGGRRGAGGEAISCSFIDPKAPVNCGRGDPGSAIIAKRLPRTHRGTAPRCHLPSPCACACGMQVGVHAGALEPA